MDENVQPGWPSFAEPRLIVLPEITADAVEEAVGALWERGFFAILMSRYEDRRGGTRRS